MKSLNKQQDNAAAAESGITLLIAGAGTGKTSTLVEKVKNIITFLKIKPEEILILTFSRRAAAELRVRIMKRTSCSFNITTGTFHSFCIKFLRDNRDYVISKFGFEIFPVVLGQKERNHVLETIIYPMLEKFRGLPVAVIKYLIEFNHKIDNKVMKNLKESGILGNLEEVKDSYVKYKIKNCFIDYDDMMNYTIEILKTSEQIRLKTIEKYKYILVDEFQDTSDQNFELLKMILPENNANLFVVGDDKQSIYGFRNARIKYIVDFQKYFPQVKILRLNVNYRSRPEIVSLSNMFIRNNRFQAYNNIKPDREKGGKIIFHYTSGFEDEIIIIENILKKQDENVETSAIIFRNNKQGEYISNNIDNNYNNILLTMHASKGLEFDRVIIGGISDYIIPDHSSDIEEERRLFYVALTRAREVLHIIFHRNDDGDLPIFAKELGL